MVSKTILQAFSFFIISAELGPSELGVYITAFTISGLMSIFFDFGRYFLIIETVKSKKNVKNRVWGRIFESVKVMPLSIAISCSFYFVFSELDIATLFATAFAILVFDKFNSYVSAILVAEERMGINLIIDVVYGFLRLIAALALVSYGVQEAWIWGGAVCLTSGIVALCSFWWLLGSYPILFSKLELASYKQIFKSGLPYSISNCAQGASAEIDKLSLSFIAGMLSVGQYAVASRFANFLNIPCNAILRVIFSRVYNEPCFKLRFLFCVRALLFISTGFFGAAILVFTLAPYVIYIVGEEFSGAVPILQVLCFVPVFMGGATLFLNYLTACGHQHLRAKLSVLFLILSVILNIVFISIFNEVGAAYATMLSFLLYFLVTFLYSFKVSKASA